MAMCLKYSENKTISTIGFCGTMATSRSISLAQMLNCAQLTNPPCQRHESAHAWTGFPARTTLHRLTCNHARITTPHNDARLVSFPHSTDRDDQLQPGEPRRPGLLR
jgi:hypothetical protein